ncbi:MAG TPA: hypothetical protein DDW92_02550 [Candidatus Veblenbacteria bacterium]|uniref:Uncharacterized protein n=4 Tax=Candidatus Vebleniibacteriota TaxID=1817921 RepID=A0A1G2QBA6_9BACT|nr:MAG: hypothetical protein A2226_01820 [Candidatus Veblenbacteria bacterium RIFOXYA2_FULL_43_9]OHA55283.1 MAG: hypothetical protein A2388_03350 [Candidatus Veblenbacteria bacterium RIFOXYB1_FULL_43_13]OHA57212.1 MAG: hypothetical protein A2441_00560 [Candidatus Veblenbacteria bacterium RIFOXYC2_FULL_42_11]OHA57854.1 MAG: hypothetical protein A2588_02975 [Candidatus Veblenbacteria bacterium RIFOXYD1_FULL_43_11]HAO81800.1 hypothetical protein [Candidatus Veblenbacteria bacterium]
MRLSPLQKFILKACYTSSARVIGRSGFIKFYETQKQKPKAGDMVNIITKSLESLIDKGLMVGYGIRTPEKWYIKEVRLLPQGRRVGRKLLGEQQTFPFKLRSNKK